MESQDRTEALIDAVAEACAKRCALTIQGGGTKRFYGRSIEGTPLSMVGHCGVVCYEPTELVITARSGTPLVEIEKLLTEKRQMLPFEPPHFGEQATIGGAVAAGLSGPRRLYAGAVRDNVLGVEIINGKGERLSFGGKVMKNVAGYDLSRLMAGSLGTLGVLLQVSIKVLPRPLREMTFAQTLEPAQAIIRMTDWAAQPLPISATWYDGHDLYCRLSGSEHAIRKAAKITGGDQMDWSEVFWTNIQEHSETFFVDDMPLWRLALPSATPPITLPGQTAMEWSGALRWLKADAPTADIRQKATEAGGHATLFRGGDRQSDVFQPLSRSLMAIHKKIKKAMDPHQILNPGRMYPEL